MTKVLIRTPQYYEHYKALHGPEAASAMALLWRMGYSQKKIASAVGYKFATNVTNTIALFVTQYRTSGTRTTDTAGFYRNRNNLDDVLANYIRNGGVVSQKVLETIITKCCPSGEQRITTS